ncbi:hypothetical protein HD806DRAFT_24278 [Xylariaceae sp. AK1471]|nr:hypothetical protein HD806DRAFT_24278 [Xylariaceae sp. AK1471]
MSISIRESIRWLPDAASEPTSTVVLTSPEHHFVDIRILKHPDEQSPSGLDWAFAGISSTEIRDGVHHSTWRHAVDSRTHTAEDVVDEGDVFPQDEGHTLETGRMMNPATGKLTNYEEIWSDLDARRIIDGRSSQQQAARCFVLELRDDAREQRGMVICLGGYSQGIARIGDKFAAERWLWEDGKWLRKYRVGDLSIPNPEDLYSTALSLGEEVKSEDPLQRWRVVEMSES